MGKQAQTALKWSNLLTGLSHTGTPHSKFTTFLSFLTLIVSVLSVSLVSLLRIRKKPLAQSDLPVSLHIVHEGANPSSLDLSLNPNGLVIQHLISLEILRSR